MTLQTPSLVADTPPPSTASSHSFSAPPQPAPPPPKALALNRGRSVRTLFISDVHVGCKHARVRECLDFLRGFRPETLYLVGDFIDAWMLGKRWHWTEHCDALMALVRDWTRQGIRIRYVPGNHDAFLRHPLYRSWLPEAFANVELENEFRFESKAGMRYLVTHGDQFDFVENRAQWMSKALTPIYSGLLSVNRSLSRVRRVRHSVVDPSAGNPYAACLAIKNRAKQAVRFLSRYETALARHARSNQCEGVICGHIHQPVIRRQRIEGESIVYCNTGDWVENCSALIEEHDGHLHLHRTYRTPAADAVESVRDAEAAPPVAAVA
ncbi:MAG: UDP-2,3-diacylglucosamine diphosphatase [Planctomycetota bacterium]